VTHPLLQGLPRAACGAILAACACGAAIIWADGPDGRHVALDAHPAPDGTWVLTPGQGTGRPARPLADGEQPPPGAARHTRHADTCGKTRPSRAQAAPALALPAGSPAGARFRVLVTGSRAWADAAAVTAALEALRAEHGHRLAVVHGACPRGADAIADAWCRARGVPAERHQADWAGRGRGAGMARDAAMAATRPDLCLAFILDASPGATRCARLAEEAGVRTLRHTARTTPLARGCGHHRAAASGTARGAARGGGAGRRDALLAAALGYAARGWRVFPVHPDAKKPPALHAERACPRCGPCAAGHRTWEERATADPELIERAWRHAPYNIGIACGPSGLVVVDLDVPGPGEAPPPGWALPGVRGGADVLAALAERHGQAIEFGTFATATPRGGQHLYYASGGSRAANTAGGRGNGLGWKVDTRGRGGYVVAPPSAVRGQPYTVVHDAAPAPLPLWLAELLNPPPTPPLGCPPPAGGVAGLSAYVRAALQGERDRVAGAAPGTRNHTLNKAAYNLGRLVGAGALAADTAAAQLTAAAAAHLGPGGLSPAEIRATIASGVQAGAKRPRRAAGA
jgi:hypothetical protein